MHTDELIRILSTLFKNSSIKFLGVFPSDCLPNNSFINSHTPCSYISNTDPSNCPGSHWVAFFHPKPYKLIFFDSYGFPPTLYGFTHVKDFSLTHNPYKIQSFSSMACGQYCILFLYLCITQCNVFEILKRFSLLPCKKSDHLMITSIDKIKKLLKIN